MRTLESILPQAAATSGITEQTAGTALTSLYIFGLPTPDRMTFPLCDGWRVHRSWYVVDLPSAILLGRLPLVHTGGYLVYHFVAVISNLSLPMRIPSFQAPHAVLALRMHAVMHGHQP
jgi:hypothetical protein